MRPMSRRLKIKQTQPESNFASTQTLFQPSEWDQEITKNPQLMSKLRDHCGRRYGIPIGTNVVIMHSLSL
jgi:hypothetical protein